MIPSDPRTFVAAAQRAFNAYDWQGCVDVYSDGAVLESVTDGASERHEGKVLVGLAWRVYLAVLKDAGLTLEKTLLAASGDTIVNEWTGVLGDGSRARGIERWTFDDASRVREHTLFSFLDVRPSTDGMQRLRLLVAYPRMALNFLTERRRAARADVG